MSNMHGKRPKSADAELASWVCTCGHVQAFEIWSLTENSLDVQDRDTKFACDDCGRLLEDDNTLVNDKGEAIKKFGGLNLMASRLEIYGWQCCQCLPRKINMAIDKKMGAAQHSCVTNGYHPEKPHHCVGCYVVNRNYEILTTMEDAEAHSVEERVPHGALHEHWGHWKRIQANTAPGPLLGVNPEQVLAACEKFIKKQFDTAVRNKRKRARDGQAYDPDTVHQNYHRLRGPRAPHPLASASGASTSAQDATQAEVPDVDVGMADADSGGGPGAQTPRGTTSPQDAMDQEEDYTSTTDFSPQSMEASMYQQNHRYQDSALGSVADFGTTQSMDSCLSSTPIGQFNSIGSPGHPDLGDVSVDMNLPSQNTVQTCGYMFGSQLDPWAEAPPGGYHAWDPRSPDVSGSPGKSLAAIKSTPKGSSKSKSSTKGKAKAKSHSKSSDKGKSSSSTVSPATYASSEDTDSYASPSCMENFQEEGFYDPDGNFIPYGPPPEEGFRAWERPHEGGYHQ